MKVTTSKADELPGLSKMSTSTISITRPRRNCIPEQSSTAAKAATLVVVVVPFLGLLFAVVSLWGWGCNWVEVGLLLGMYVLTGLGITVGFHRLFTHRAFETSPVVQSILGILGSMAIEAPLLKWVAVHRLHHQYSDEENDPHSPHFHGTSVVGVLRGFWYAHLGWLFKADPPNLSHYDKDLRQSGLLRRVSKLFPLWAVLGVLIPTILGGVLGGGWLGALLGFVWGGLARIFLVHHVTWSINSVCHLWGSQPFHSHDQSKNNFLIGVLALGEGWHNNHHAFPTSARHGLRWWQLDVSYWVIRALALLGLAWKVKLPEKQALIAAVES
jgi:stearoyl-CoA desaturase (delta-9 desaturase)